MCLRFTGKTIAKKVETSPSNGFEPTTHEKGRMPISNRLRPKGFLELDRCAIGWSYIYDHSTNPVKYYILISKTIPISKSLVEKNYVLF